MNWNQILNEITFTAIRSRGPGGQNVNKVSSSARLNWNLAGSAAFSGEEHLLVLGRLANTLTREGELLLRSDEFRDLERNKARCLEKLRDILDRALFVPKPRKKTKPSFSEKKRREKSKQRHSEVKKNRKRVDY